MTARRVTGMMAALPDCLSLPTGYRLRSCMKFNAMFGLFYLSMGYEKLSKEAKYHIGKNDNGRLYLVNFHPAGEPEAFMTLRAALTAPFVIKGSE